MANQTRVSGLQQGRVCPPNIEWERRLFHIKGRVNLYWYIISYHRSSRHVLRCQLFVEPLPIPPEIALPRLCSLKGSQIRQALLTGHSRFALSELLSALTNHWRELPQGIHTSPELQSHGGHQTWVLCQQIRPATGKAIIF